MITGVLSIIALAASFLIGKASKTLQGEDKKITSFVSKATLALSIILMAFASTKVVEPGTVEVETFLGTVKQEAFPEGLHWPVNPFASWTEYDIRLHTSEFIGSNHFQCLSKDSKEFFLEANVSWLIVPKHASWTRQNIGDAEKVIRGAQATSLRLAGGKFDLMDVSANLEEIERAATLKGNDSLKENLKNAYGVDFSPFLITKVDIRKPELPDSIQTAISAKLQKQQESEAMEFVISKERQEAERKKIEAQGIADFQKIVTEGINPNLLYWKYIEVMQDLAKSTNTTFIFAPDGRNNPFVTTLPLVENNHK